MLHKYLLFLPAMNVFFSNLFQKMAHRLRAAFSTIPDTNAWLQATALLLVLAVISLSIGFQLGFLRLQVLDPSWHIVGIVISCLFSPAISEELVFRVLLLPHPTENTSTATQWLWGCISLALFIIYHPFNGLSFYPAGLKTFLNPVFLSLAALLGIVCSIIYVRSGSIWPAVAIHWLVVVVWVLLLGGYGRLSQV